MSDTTQDSYSPAGYGQMKTLAVRLSEDVRAQLDILAQLNDRTVTEEIRLSIEAWIAASKADPKVQQRAEQVRAEIEREANTKRNAISAIFDGPKAGGTRQAPAARSGKKEGE